MPVRRALVHNTSAPASSERGRNALPWVMGAIGVAVGISVSSTLGPQRIITTPKITFASHSQMLLVSLHLLQLKCMLSTHSQTLTGSQRNLERLVVLADRRVFKTKRRPRKTSTGYNLTSLFVSAEGPLGIVTKATLKLAPIP